MIDNILNIVRLILAIAPFVILCLISKRVNLNKSDRSKQLLMPVFGFVYVIVAMILMTKINNWVINLIESVSSLLYKLSESTKIPERAAEWICTTADNYDHFLYKLNIRFWIFFVANALIIAAFLILKKFLIKLFNKAVKTESSLHTNVSGLFYTYFSEKGVWALKTNYTQMRDLFKILYYFVVGLSSFMMLISVKFYKVGVFRAMFYPVFGVICLGELYFYLDGNTRGEYVTDIFGEDEEAYRTVNYSLLRKYFRSLFKDKLLTENTTINNALANDITNDEIIAETEADEDQKIVSFAEFFKGLNATGFQLDHNYYYSSLDMLKGKSVLFNNPFYNDLIPYAFYPLNRTLLSHRKALVILGRHAIENDIAKWVEKGIESVTANPYMWNIGVLTEEKQEYPLDIGIITRSDVLNMKVHEVNDAFLSEVGFVIILEPSKLIPTAQIGLNILAKKCRGNDEHEIVYCLCDKNCDGLVDAMSHILMTNFTEVSATNKHKGTSSYMCWDSDGEYIHHRITPNISRYLGIGTELSFAALKNQVSLTQWFGGDAFPVVDINWIDKQYYYDLMKYAGLPAVQEEMDRYFKTSHNFWSSEIRNNNCVTVEDEAYNMFEILRDFSTRSTEQGFINVISSEYLLKDYMADNSLIFETDPKAIPFIVPDYARTNRNIILRILLMMSTFPLNTDDLVKELSLLGIEVFNLEKQLWYEVYNCYASVSDIESLPEDYREAVEAVSNRTIDIDGLIIDRNIFDIKDRFDIKTSELVPTYFISNREFFEKCIRDLKSAGYVSEDEKGQKNFLGSELRGHIDQKYLPGQFFTFAGKYYEILYLTADGQLLIRRAADHINGRPMYRQIRRYELLGIRQSDKIGSYKNISGLRISKEFADISVKTDGYYRMENYGNFKTAKKVLFEGEKTGIPERKFSNKEIIRIEFPADNPKFTDKVRYTVTLLLNEVFRSVFAENQPYISAVTDLSFMNEADCVNPLTYSLSSDCDKYCNNCIYIIEDSQLDLGLTIAVERNIERILLIVQDYLDWHLETLENSLIPPVEPVIPIVIDNTTKPEETKKKKCFLKRFFEKFRKKKPEDDADGEKKPTDENEGSDNDNETDGKKKKKRRSFIEWLKSLFRRKKKKDDPDEVPEIPEEKPDDDDIDDINDGEKEPDDSDEDDEEIDTDFGDDIIDDDPFDDDISDDDDFYGDDFDDSSDSGDLDLGSDDIPEADSDSESDDDSSEFIEDDDSESETFEPDFSSEYDENSDMDSEETDNTEKINDAINEDLISELLPDLPDCIKKKKPVNEVKEVINIEEAEKKEPEDLFKRKPYHERYYLLFGGEAEPDYIDPIGTLEALSDLGISAVNPMKQAREGKKIAEIVAKTYKPNKNNVVYCDFCGSEIFGVEYETLADGRDRCINCGRTAVKTGEEFKKIFEDVKRNMESFFSIKINAGIRVEMVNSKTLHKRLGESFVPTSKSDGRVLGVAIKEKDGFTLLVENGSPRMASMLTIAHELTHIWQYINWDDKAILKKYGRGLRLEIYEGMAKWAEIQYAYLINEPATAMREQIITSYRNDVYGYAFLRYYANYSLSTGTVLTKPTPFMNIDEPLSPEFCGNLTVNLPPTGGIFGNPEDDDNGNKPNPDPNPGPDPISGEINRNPENFSKYAYGCLNDNEKALYDTVYKAINEFVEELTEFPGVFNNEDLFKIVKYVLIDHPEIIWFEGKTSAYSDSVTSVLTKVSFHYCMDSDEAKSRMEKIEAALKPFVSEINDSLSDYEVALRIYKNIISLVDYDTVSLDRQKRRDEIPEPDDLRSIYGVFVNKKAVCAGYAKAFQYLNNLFGIECSYATSDTHAWNIIKIEGSYYHLDCTWGDHSNTKGDLDISDDVFYDYFCLTTDEILKLSDHLPEKHIELPLCTDTSCNYHHRHGFYFESFDFDSLRDVSLKSVENGQLLISFKFADSSVYKQATDSLISNHKFGEIIQYINLRSKNRVASRYHYFENAELNILTFRVEKM